MSPHSKRALNFTLFTSYPRLSVRAWLFFFFPGKLCLFLRKSSIVVNQRIVQLLTVMKSFTLSFLRRKTFTTSKYSFVKIKLKISLNRESQTLNQSSDSMFLNHAFRISLSLRRRIKIDTKTRCWVLQAESKFRNPGF